MISLVAATFMACNTPTQQKDLKAKIDSVEQVITNSLQKTENPDIQLTLTALQYYQDYCKENEKDSLLCPEYLFKSAQLWGNVLQRHDRAIADYQKIRSNYPTHKKTPAALFFEANEWEQAGDTTTAIRLYADFMVSYPEHPLREQARATIDFLKMSPAARQKMFNP